ncbi:conserved protein of unknown function [Moritella yayanosii]|uniref:Uncharacterized protein n=1 Tax=Moritella yayanosii TaxID=69539 RepID=A0A330LSG4_9GAMM|nr:conserved protein of unknown function [Moritella yayanosii]
MILPLVGGIDYKFHGGKNAENDQGHTISITIFYFIGDG